MARVDEFRVTERDGDPHSAAHEEIARAAGVRIMLGAGLSRVQAGYNRGHLVVGVVPGLLAEDPRTVAAILAHELTHAEQHAAARRGEGPEGRDSAPCRIPPSPAGDVGPPRTA